VCLNDPAGDVGRGLNPGRLHQADTVREGRDESVTA
jgi:hypothetical protein